jgi:hypothetical protein
MEAGGVPGVSRGRWWGGVGCGGGEHIAVACEGVRLSGMLRGRSEVDDHALVTAMIVVWSAPTALKRKAITSALVSVAARERE